MAFLLVIVKAVVEIAGLALVGQFVVGLLAGGRRATNPVWQLFALVASPFTRLVRLAAPRVVLDRHVPLATLLLLSVAWLFVLLELRAACTHQPAQAGCPPPVTAGRAG